MDQKKRKWEQIEVLLVIHLYCRKNKKVFIKGKNGGNGIICSLNGKII